MQGMVKQALSNLEKNGFRAVYVNDRDELMKLIASMIPEGSVTASGGSETLEETGVLAWLKEMTDYRSDRKEAYGAAYYLLHGAEAVLNFRRARCYAGLNNEYLHVYMSSHFQGKRFEVFGYILIEVKTHLTAEDV